MYVLIIEETRDSANGLAEFLETRGHIVDTVGVGLLSRNIAHLVQFDAIILFTALENTDRAGLCRKLRTGGCSSKPVMVIAGPANLNEKIACMEAGADDYLAKPVSEFEIASRLRVLFRLSSASRQIKAN